MKSHEAEEVARMNPELSEKVKHLEKEVAYYKDESGKSQAEVDRLLEILREVETEKNDKDKRIAELERQVKDQNKKMVNLKHSQQVEKKKNTQLLEEVRKREDIMIDNSQHIQLEELMNILEKTRQELDSTKVRLSSTQQSLAEKDAHLTNLRLERRKQLEEILEMKQEALLAAISEKDANIALLELSASKKKKSQEEVMALKREKDRLVHQLKQQTQNRMKLMADNYDEEHHHHVPHHPHHPHHHPHHRSPGRPSHTNHRPSPDQMIQSLFEKHSHGIKLKIYIDHLTTLCLEQDAHFLKGFPSLPADDVGNEESPWEQEVFKLTPEQLTEELEKEELKSKALQEFTDHLLQSIADSYPDILEQVIEALEEES